MAILKDKSQSIELPKLMTGDRLSRCEFERRYHQMPNVKKAELIEGVVYMSSPVRHRKHGKPHAQITTWLGVYVASTPNIELSDNATVRLDLDNEPQPDALLRIETEADGASYVSEDDFIEGAPELVVEIAGSTVSYDLHDKKSAYRRNGVKEYLVWRIDDKAFDWFVLGDDGYEKQEPQSSILKSQTFIGLSLHVDALLDGDMTTVLTTLQD